MCAGVEGADGFFGKYEGKLEGSCRFEQIVIWIQAHCNMVTAYLAKRYQESNLRLHETGKAYSERGLRAIVHNKQRDPVEAISKYTYWP